MVGCSPYGRFTKHDNQKVMQIDSRVIVNGKKGRLIWKDNDFINPHTNEPHDILVKVKFEDVTEVLRMSELTIDNDPIEETIKSNMKAKINFNQFLEIEKQLEIRYGKITSVERMPKSDKMLKLTVDFGTEERIVMTNIGSSVEDLEVLLHKFFPYITNLEPAKIMGVISEAMIMVPTMEDGTINLGQNPLIGNKLL